MAQVGLIMTLLFRTPFRKLHIMALDRLKRGRGPVVVKTVAATLIVVLASTLYSMLKIQRRAIDAALVNPTDQVLMSKHMLEASLMGFVLFLGLMIDRLHHYIRELWFLRKTMETEKNQSHGHEDKKYAEELKLLEKEIVILKTKIKNLKSEYETKSKEVNAAQAEAKAVSKQSEGLLLEYDRLLEDNQNLQNQLDSIGQCSS
ncbi:B-cell receptor-associated 31-like protein [Corchorus capsularis]|uniref:Endoplasmic reticulum transmembrane protein n=1 Tax=Corchorus capsularis TaxID=210143 RepID=A0A1R3IKI1_COCAP|nr:B-cell receptor-associated 31-like protein [Corchorus capsularis]